MYTWNVYNFANQCQPNNFNKKDKRNLPANKSIGPDGFTGVSPNIQRKTDTYSSQTISKYSRRGKIPKFILQG